MATTKTAAKPAAKKTTTKSSSSKAKSEGNEFQDFFVDELKDIYWAEKHLAKALPKMQKAATSEELAMAFEKHTQETKLHAEILEQVFGMFDEKAVAKKCDAMAGLLEEADGIIEDTEEGTMIRDAALILAAQKVEHYEIATYGTLVVFARTMGRDDVADLLAQVLENEKATDVALTTVAEGFINKEAASE
ncbi:ferritin-like domain-containing protein [Pedobacter polaris]|uniref:Ferritin-like domain-containing protein n=1 Tax=Pedobacter polaris TaxID=2571273 RepID=A0A4V5P019_9SPHI|nr:ferritin-like domain-containing protein [Pedobacter polaris]TKC10942.1 ferritin-like domain-containing protein [Pedobacter polaris]